MIDFQTHPDQYKHWKLTIDGSVATIAMDVDEDGGLKPGYQLKLNSYDLGVDIELYDATQRLRFEHPEVGAVILTSAKDNVFCAGANIKMLGLSAHAEKVNFCKFTNETRNGLEDATSNSRQTYLCAINGTAAGGGYEVALATDHIMLVDDNSSAVSLPEVPLLAVLPGTGGLTRVVDKRKVRRDHADFFCTLTEGIRGERAVKWNLVDEIVPRSKMDETVAIRAKEFAAKTDRPGDAKGVELTAPNRKIEDGSATYDNVSAEFDRKLNLVNITVNAPKQSVPSNPVDIHAQGVDFWPLALARELDDLILHLRTNEPELGLWVFRTQGDADLVAEADKVLADNADDWLVREVSLFLKRVLKRIDVTSRSIITLVEPGSCFTGTLAELLFAADRSFMLDGVMKEGDTPATVRLTSANFGDYPMCNDLTRLQTRFLDDDASVEAAKAAIGKDLDAASVEELGLVTFIPDDIDWEDEVRVSIEQRVAMSPDSLTGMEASLRFAGPETLETKIFGRLSAWQNWIFQRPNAVGAEGALKLFGSGKRAGFDMNRV
ncbi:MAG: 2,3-epoxybenzoyl-CoA dihydrolase [Rhodospirillales bacterium]|jgi:benzoyl-CoA-dihydrodiol lyase|nr:2,3-epoxybenzoyl-CoA dihydrolase [Rhodospirillales bacterium]MBT4007210.1 2,3-epoxybenzoyl-CoA dihydrolase [Rhodospirillales bacterium]MBT5075977.1 2,3-epoxybenzoyl-CoA dihydrolase [Rhodospirillales bacterium]MBT5113543.1 2,3-epoxybenzoyl-CoA dihydrolase [Rhodospirillales bacterium]MBT5673841.1 2,3-epoxybenzoyl-CoA dihydrolase [Rhodospirillales bacterium]